MNSGVLILLLFSTKVKMPRHETFLFCQSNQLDYPSVTIDKQSRTVTYASELQDEYEITYLLTYIYLTTLRSTRTVFPNRTVLLDGLLLPSDFKSTFEFDVMGKIVSELLQGLNTSLILIGGQDSNIADVIQGGANGMSEEFGTVYI